MCKYKDSHRIYVRYALNHGFDHAECFLHLRGNRYYVGNEFFILMFDAHSKLGREVSRRPSIVFNGRQEAGEYLCSAMEDIERVLTKKVVRGSTLVAKYEEVQAVRSLSHGTPSMLPIYTQGNRRLNATFLGIVFRVVGDNKLLIKYDIDEIYAGGLIKGNSKICGEFRAFLSFIVSDVDYEEMANHARRIMK